MKKKVFSLMMTLLLAFVGIARADELTVNEGTTTNDYVPVYGFYADAYLKCEFVQPAADLADMNGATINGVTFYASQSSVNWGSANFQVFLNEVGSTSISSFAGPGTVVYTGALSISGGVMTVTFTTPYTYNGGNLLIGVYNTVTGNYVTSSWYGVSASGASVQGYNYSSLSSVSASQRNFLPKMTFDYTGGGGGAGDQIFAVQDGEIVDTVFVGPRPNGCWMEPFTFQIRNTGANTTITNLDWTPNTYFTLVDPELPVDIARNEDIDVQLTTGESSNTDWQMVAIYGTGRTAAIWNINVEPYDPAIPDVWELAYDFGTIAAGFSYQGVPSQITPTTLHNDYTLPFPEIEEGEDAVYKFEVATDMILNAYVDENAANGKVALYTEDFNGEGGPMATNNYTGMALSGGASAMPFEAQIGEGTSTSGYFPFYSLYNYSLSAELFLAAELAEAGVTTAPFTSLSWNATNSITQDQNNITIWMANEADTQVPATSPLASGMTKVYTGNLTQPTPTGWVEFVFNEGTFSWDGSSNILILCQRNNGSWTSSIQWQYHNPGFLARGYVYTDSAPYDVTTTAYSWSTSSTTRANIIMKGGNREGGNRDLVDFEDGNMPAGWDASQGYNDWYVDTEDYWGQAPAYSGSYSLYVDGNGEYANDYFVSPATEFAGAGSLSFAYATPSWSGDQNDLSVGYSTSQTGPWTIFPAANELQSENWQTVNLDLSSLNGTYYIAFISYDGYGYCTAIDNINLVGSSNGGGGTPTPGPTPTPGTALNISAGPVIENLPIAPGTYYLVASATQADYDVFINADNMPCPAIDAEGFALNPQPADDEDEVEPASVTLRWMVPEYATGWRLIFGTTYYPDPNHPQTVMYPEDGSFTDHQMANSYTVRNLWNNTNYFWRVEFNNDACPDGVSSPVWGFTTHLNVPQNLTAVDETVFNDETIVLNWNAVVDRTYRQYNVYRDGVCIGHTTVNNIGNTTYTDGPLAYNMGGYVYYVTAVYDEGESAPSNTVTVKVSGRGNVNGHVFEQDGTTGIANATVHMVGTDEFGVTQTYNFTTNGQGYYSGAVYAGSYNGSASCNGYQTITEPVQGNPIAITYNVTTSPIDYILDENFDPVCGVIAEYYPDSLDPNSPYVKVYWGCGLPGSEIIEDFETGDFSMFDWQVEPTYPWVIDSQHAYEGNYCMKSGNQQVLSSASTMQVTVNIPADGLMSFFGKISCESGWDYGYFYIDGVQKGSYTGEQNWAERTFDITAGDHTFMWKYEEDFMISQGDDCFYVDYITFYKQPEPAIPGMTYDFEDGSMQGWTSVDADGDGHGWYVASEVMGTGYGHNGSNDCVLSQSYDNNVGVLYPDNYLVSPQVQLGGVVRFYACAQDASYAAEHFGVAVSTTNTQPGSFTTIQEWTMSAKGVPAPRKVAADPSADVKGIGHSRGGNLRAQGNWYEYTVDLSAYSGMGYVAIRHFNCSDMFYLDVDDITIGEPGKGVAETRSLDHYRIYRTNCYNDGPYTEENTVLLATNWPGDTIYIDVEWADLEPGVYKWGVGCVYSGNRGEMTESPISWAAPVNVNRSFTTSEAAQKGPKATVEMAEAQDRDRAYLQYSTETFSGGVGTGGGAVYWGIRFPAADLAAYAGQTLTEVGVFTDVDGDYGWTYSGNYTAMVFQGGTSAPGTLVSQATEYLAGDYAWHDITLTTPVTIDASQDLWLCFYTPDIAYPMSGCDYTGNANSDYLSLDGTTWEHAADYGLNYTWMIRGNVEAGGPTPGPTPGGNNLNQLALPRESETIWSNCLDKDMYLAGDVTVNVLLNSADSPEGVQVTFTNYNEYEQQTYGGYDITLDESGYYAFESFRKGEYKVNVTFDGYEPIEDSVSIWEPTDLRYVMIEIIYGVSDLYVSSTGWAMWGAMGTPGGQGGGGGQGGNGDTFSVDFEAGLPAGWTTIDGGSPAGYGWQLISTKIGAGNGHNGSNDGMLSQSYDNNYGIVYPDNYLVSPMVNIAAGSTFSFYACAQDANYAAEHFGVFVSDNGTSNWTMVNEWTIGQKGTRYEGPRGQRDQSAWTLYSVDLSAYAGQKYIAIRHFNCSDQFYLDVDDIALSNGAKDAEAERHLESFKVLCTSLDGEPIFNTNVPAEQPFCQLATDDLVAGDHYICKVAAMYSTGMSDWTECEWQYIPCENYAGTVSGVTIEGNEISWEYPGGGPVPPQPGVGDEFTVDFEAGMPAGWTTIDGGSPQGYGWQLISVKIGTGYGHNGSSDGVLSQSYDNNYGVVYPDNYLVSPQVNLVNGSTFSFYACAQDASYAAEHFGVFVSDNGTSNWTMVNEWTMTAKGGNANVIGRDGRATLQGNWYQYSVDLSAFAGQKYIAIRHFNCSDMFYLDVDDIELSNGAKSNRAAWDLMMTFTAPEGGHYGVAYDGSNFYTSNWGYSSAAYNFYQYDLSGNMIEGFNISGCGTLRGMTYDGQYFYGVANSSTVYCVDLAAHSVVSTFTSAYGAMRGITYDPARDGFWVIGNWSGNLTLIDRTGAIQQTGPAPTSASDLAYYKDENDVEHVYCFNNGTNDVEDWVIGNPAVGGSVFNFSAVPGFASGSSGGCTVGSFNGKIAFIGDIQQSPNLIGVYELRDDDTPAPVPTPTGDVLGAMIFADGEWEAFVEYPTNTYTYEGDAEEVCVRIVYNGTNTLPEGNIYFSMSCPECEPFEPGQITCEMDAAIHGELVDANHIKVWWGDEPQAPVEEWLYYDDGTYGTSVGAGGTLYWGTMFPAASLAPYAGTSLTKVAVHTSYACSATLNVYVGGAQPGGSPAATQNFTMAGDQEFMEITLNNPVAVDGTQNLWITFYQSGETYPADACNDTGDANNRWVSIDGASWMDLATAGLPGYGWMIRGFVTNQAKGGEVVALPEFRGEAGNGQLSHTEVVSKPADLSFMNRSEVVKYNVYRSTEAAGEYELIGEVTEETAPNYYEYIDSPTAAGTYYYQVRALYDDGCLSEPAQAFDNPAHNYVSETTTAMGVGELGTAIYPNPTKGNVTIEAVGMRHITVVSTLGQVVFDADVEGDSYIMNMSQYTAGMYTVRVVTESGVSAQRITVVR